MTTGGLFGGGGGVLTGPIMLKGGAGVLRGEPIGGLVGRGAGVRFGGAGWLASADGTGPIGVDPGATVDPTGVIPAGALLPAFAAANVPTDATAARTATPLPTVARCCRRRIRRPAAAASATRLPSGGGSLSASSLLSCSWICNSIGNLFRIRVRV
jgi:hypothetical protein